MLLQRRSSSLFFIFARGRSQTPSAYPCSRLSVQPSFSRLFWYAHALRAVITLPFFHVFRRRMFFYRAFHFLLPHLMRRNKLFAHLHSDFMPFQIVIAIRIQIQSDDGKTVLSVKRNRVLVAGLRFQNKHPCADALRCFLHGFHQPAADSAAALVRVKHAYIADSETVIPAFQRAFDESDHLLPFKRAECQRLLQPCAEEHVVKSLFDGCFKARVSHLKARFGCLNIVIAVCPIADGKLFPHIFSASSPIFVSISSMLRFASS